MEAYPEELRLPSTRCLRAQARGKDIQNEVSAVAPAVAVIACGSAGALVAHGPGAVACAASGFYAAQKHGDYCAKKVADAYLSKVAKTNVCSKCKRMYETTSFRLNLCKNCRQPCQNMERAPTFRTGDLPSLPSFYLVPAPPSSPGSRDGLTYSQFEVGQKIQIYSATLGASTLATIEEIDGQKVTVCYERQGQVYWKVMLKIYSETLGGNTLATIQSIDGQLVTVRYGGKGEYLKTVLLQNGSLGEPRQAPAMQYSAGCPQQGVCTAAQVEGIQTDVDTEYCVVAAAAIEVFQILSGKVQEHPDA